MHAYIVSSRKISRRNSNGVILKPLWNPCRTGLTLGSGGSSSYLFYWWRTPTEPLPRPVANQRAAPWRQGLSLVRAVGRGLVTASGQVWRGDLWASIGSPRRLDTLPGIWTGTPSTTVWRRRREVDAASRTLARCLPGDLESKLGQWICRVLLLPPLQIAIEDFVPSV